MQASVEINGAFFRQVDKELAGLAMLHRMPAIKKGGRAAMNIVKNRVRETLPKPGYPGDKKELEPLRNTATTKVVEYPNGTLVFLMGYRWDGGQHGHNVEEGHRIAKGGTLTNPKRKTQPKSKVTGERGGGSVAGFVEGRHDISNAAKATESAQSSAMSAGIQEAIAQNKQGSTNG